MSFLFKKGVYFSRLQFKSLKVLPLTAKNATALNIKTFNIVK